MKVLLNFLPLKTGGGVQVALDFIKNVDQYGKEYDWYIVCRTNSPFKKYITNSRISLTTEVKDNFLSRVWFEYIGCKKIIKTIQPNVIYTQFGPQWPGANCIQIAGCAYSNLFYPELNFWGKLPFHQRIIKYIIDHIRLKRILSVDIRIFETEDLANRAKEQYNLASSSVYYVRSAPSSLVSKSSIHDKTAKRCKNLPAGYKILLISSYHPNKNIEFLVETAAKLESRDHDDDTLFILTLPKNDPKTNKIMQLAKQLGVEHRIYNFGSVPQEGCSELYKVCNATILPSTLESFSNMIAESWIMKKPLLISNLSWSKTLCGNGAIYYGFLDSSSLIDSVITLKNDAKLESEIIHNGLMELDKYPTSKERFLSYLQIINQSTTVK